MFPVAAASIMSRRLVGRVAHGAPLVRNRVARSVQVNRRSFNDWGSPIPEPEFTPGETILLDVTAWIVALALVYTPSGASSEIDDEENNDRRLRTGKKNDRDTARRASGKDH